MIWLIYLFLGSGLAFQVLGVLALHRFPDVYTRLHGSTKCTTLGSILFYVGIIFYSFPFLAETGVLFSAHLLALMFLLMITNSTGAHAMARASHRIGIVPKGKVVDRLEEDRRH